MGQSGNKLFTNMLWKFAERISAQIVTLIVSVILARLLEPEHYGIISIVTIFITIANVLVSDGFGSSLIQKKDADALDFSSVLYFNIGFSILLYALLYFAAPYITLFYGEGYGLLTPVLRVLGIRIIISGINSVQHAYVSKQMIFKKFFLSTLFGTVVSAIVGISLAYHGFGVWALVFQYLTNTTVDTVVLAITLKKKPVLAFSAARLKGLLNYGIKILGSSLLTTGYLEIKALIIGKIYSSSDLAFYDKGKQFPNLLVSNINNAIGAVLFPKMAMEQDHPDWMKRTMRMSIRFTSYIMCPLMLGLAAVAEPFVRVILTEKWLPCVPLLQYFCVIYLFQPIHTANMQAIKAIGRSDISLKLEILKKSIELLVLLSVMRISVDAIVISMAVQTTLFTFVNAWPNRKLLQYRFREQVMDIAPSVGMSFVMFVIVTAIGQINLHTIPLLILQIFCGGCVYLFLSAVTHNAEFHYLLNFVKKYLRKEK